MKYLRYTECKPTNTDWFGDIPKHWILKALKHTVITPVTDGPHDTPEILDEGITFISAEAIRNDRIDFNRKRGFISLEDHQRFSRKYLPQKDDIYVIKSGATTGNIAMVETDTEFNIWSPLAAIRVDKSKALPKFIFYFLKSECFHTSIILGWSFGTQQNIGMNVIENLAIAVPTIPEQQTISAFLDYKTEQIDKLIEKKEQLLKLLEEKRIALITQAVTKGLDTNVKMKPSEVDWLGDIPEHWGLKPLKRIFLVLNGSTPKSSVEEYWDGEINWFTPDDLGNNNQVILYESRRKITEEGYESCGVKIAPAFSLALSTRAPIGHLAVIGNPGCVNQGCRLLFSQFGNPIYWYYLLIAAKQEVISFGQGSTFYELSRTKLSKILLPTPCPEEQNIILKYLVKELDKIKALEEKVFDAIEKLKEYRTSLITSAVTGKIDVRDFKPERV